VFDRGGEAAVIDSYMAAGGPYPVGVAVDREGRIVVAEFCGRRVLVL
jgi:hypothetical protein